MSEISAGFDTTVIRGSSSASSSAPKTRTNAPKTSTTRSPFVGFNEVLNSVIPVHEKGLRTGFYNSIALIFLLFVLIVIYYCYWILKPFLQALVWAILCGSALHPFKQRLFHCSIKWINEMKTNGRPITLSTILLPFVVINKSVDLIGNFVKKYRKIFGFLLTCFVIHCLGYSYICFQTLFDYIVNNPLITIILFLMKLLSHLTNPENSLIIMSLSIAFLIGLTFCWSESTQKFITFLAPFVWIPLLIHLISLSGTFGYLLSLIVISITIIGLIKTIASGTTNTIGSDQIDGLISFSLKLKNILDSISMSVISYLFKDRENKESTDKSEQKDEQNVLQSDNCNEEAFSANSSETIDNSQANSRRTSLMSNNEQNSSQSNLYLYGVLWAVIFVQICYRPKLLYLVLIPLTLKALTIGYTYFSNFIFNNIHRFNGFLEKRTEALFHPFIRNSFNYFLIGDKVIMNTIELSLNGLTSLTIIVITIVSVLFVGIFMSIQIYGESLHLVNSISNAFNKTISYYPESSQLLPQSFKGVDEMLDEMVRNGYEFGREYIKNSIQNALNVDGNVTKTMAVEKQFLEIWDRAYHLWVIRNSNDTDGLPLMAPYEFDKLFKALKTLNLYLCFNILKENIDILISVWYSIWHVLKGNVTLLFTAIFSVFSILWGGGLGVMNFGFSCFIFISALFYLLAMSGNHYKPIELVNRLFPSDVTEQTNNSFTANKFGRAVEEAINGVFAASLKMSAFYGLYTFLIHTLFNVNIVYIPSVMAAVFGAVPFLSAFWASFPAFLDLFFGQNQRTKAILLLITAYFPSFLVDSTIYSEIKSAGHPYLTGLAIAGGVFYLGFEGALFGPILLCFLFVAFNIYTSIMGDNDLPQEVSPRSTIRSTSQFRRIQSLI